MKYLSLLLALITLPGLAMAETVYISDVLYVPMRSGPGSQYRIVNRALKTGTPLTLVSEEQENNYYQVQTSSGQDGYIPAQYILFQPPAALRLQQVSGENQQLTAERKALTEKLARLESDYRKTSTELNRQKDTSNTLQAELSRIKAISSQSLDLNKRNQELVIANEQLMNELQTLQATNQQLSDSSSRQWYLYGAGTLLGGILLGVILPLFRTGRKRSNGWA